MPVTDVSAPELTSRLHLPLELGRQPRVVVVAERHEVAIVASTPLLRAPASPGLRSLVIKRIERSPLDHGERLIRLALVVDDEALDRPSVGLAENRVDRDSQEFGAVVGRHDDRHRWRAERV